SDPSPGAAVRTAPARTAADRHAVQHSVEACMPEAMAMIKLKGFIHDLGGEVVESVPGMIRVRLTEAAAARKSKGLFGWMDRARPAAPTTDLELHMERR